MDEGMRRCIGSATFGIEAHDAPVGDFPLQPSQKDGIGRMCKVHWTAYTRGLRAVSKGTISPELLKAAEAAGKGKPAPKAKVAAKAPRLTKSGAPDARNAGRGLKKARARRGDATPEQTEAHNAQVREEMQASTPDFEAAAAADPILAERRDRVMAWRRDEFNRTQRAQAATGPAKMEA